MKNLSLFACLILSGTGLFTALTKDFTAGSVLLIIGGLAFVIISHPTKKINQW